jgi:hypothetical protein
MGGDQVQSSNVDAGSTKESAHNKDKGEESSQAAGMGSRSDGKGAKEESEKTTSISELSVCNQQPQPR